MLQAELRVTETKGEKMKTSVKIISLVLALIMCCSCMVFAAEDTSSIANTALKETMASIEKLFKNGTEVGNEWMVMDLALYGSKESKIFTEYYKSVEKYVASVIPTVNVEGAKNALDKNKSTETSRLILALSAMGKYATAVNGYDLTEAYNSFKYVTRMGHMGPVWTLIALDTYGYEIADSTIRQQCVDYLLAAQLESGGWDLAKKNADVDVTAMTLQALYPYKNQAKVQSAAEKAFAWLSSVQKDNGGFSSWGTDNSESCVQVIVACCTWGINPAEDSRFVKNGHSAVENLLTFRVKDSKYGWGFAHVMTDASSGSMSYKGGEYNSMATEQAAYGLIAFNRFLSGKSNLYNMSANKPFTDVNGNAHQTEIEYCYNAGLMNGVGSQKFNPGGTFNRAMLITTMYRLAGSPKVSGTTSFTDAAKGSWYSDALKWAEDKGIAGGYGNGKFGPDDDITPEQIWTFLFRFAKLMGYDTSSSAALGNLSVSSWALDAAKWANAKEMIKQTDGKLNATSAADRALSAMYLARFDQNVK